MLSYITLGGLSAAIYNEVLQFFVILAALVPLTIFGLIRVGGWNGLKDKVVDTMASNSISSARRSPIIAAFPKMFIPFVIIVPGMIAAAAIGDMIRLKTAGEGDITYNDAMLLMIRDILPNGLLGVAIAGLLASFMAGMAANHLHRADRGRLFQLDGLPADAVRFLQRTAVRDVHPRHVLEADDRNRRLDGLGRPSSRHRRRSWSTSWSAWRSAW